MALDQKIKEQLIQYLNKLETDVVIDAFIDSEDSSNSMMDLLNEIVSVKIFFWNHTLKNFVFTPC